MSLDRAPHARLNLTHSLFDLGAFSPPPARFNLARHALDAGQPGDKPALIVADDSGGPPMVWSFAQARSIALRAAAGLAAAGARPGDRIVLRIGHEPAFPAMFFGAAAMGAIPVPTSDKLTAREIRFIAEDSGAALALVGEGLDFDAPPGCEPIGPAGIAAILSGPEAADFADTAAEDPGYLIYTSGTSGRPKGVLHAHRAVWARRMMWRDWMGLRADDRVLHAGAFNWTYTLGVGLMDPWGAGATTVIYRGAPDPAVWPRIAADHKPTIFAAAPGVFRRLLKYGADVGPGFASLRCALTAGEKLPDAVRAEWEAATGAPLYEALGMSECSTYISSGPEVPVRAGFSGRPQRGRRVAILPEAGDAPVCSGEAGLLAVSRRDPGLMLGYWRRPEEDAAAARGEWFLTGDRAAMDSDGYVAYLGRADDVMNAMGYRVSPQEVEDALAAHPDVAECAAAELRVAPDVSVIAGFVVLRSGAAARAADLLEHCSGLLAAYKRPREIVFVEALPRTATGKAQRKRLSTDYARA